MTTRELFAVGTIVALAATAGCRRADAPPPEVPSLNVTHWTPTTELYMEYPPLVAGQPALFAVHLTRLADFSAINAGRPRIELTPESGGEPIVLPGSEPLRPGAFRVEGAPPAPGRYRWALMVDAPGLSDRHDLGAVTVFATEEEAATAAAAEPGDDPSAIAYLKEQQWVNAFATAPVQEIDLRAALRVPAVIEPVTGGEAIVAAPAAGRFTANSLVSVGAAVRAGQALGRLEPRLSNSDDRATLVLAAAEAQAGADAARVELERAERLLADRAVPARRVEEAKRGVSVAEARLEAARARLSQRDQTLDAGGGAAAGNAFVLTAPIAGRVADVFATLGASYDEGAPLFRVVRTDRVELRAQVPAANVAEARTASALAFELPGRSDPLPLAFEHRHDAGIIDPKTHALPVQFEVSNGDGRLLVGQLGTAVLFQPTVERMPAVPEAAILMEAGRPYVFIQIGGERFARRYVDVAVRDAGWAGVPSGVEPGDRVVTRGAYDIQLASAATGLPAEGHVH